MTDGIYLLSAETLSHTFIFFGENYYVAAVCLHQIDFFSGIGNVSFKNNVVYNYRGCKSERVNLQIATFKL